MIFVSTVVIGLIQYVGSSVLVTRAIDFCCYATYGIYTNSIDLLL